MDKQEGPTTPIKKISLPRVARRFAVALGIVALIFCVTACSSQKATDSTTRQTSGDAQARIQGAKAHLKEAGTGRYYTEITGSEQVPEAEDFRMVMFGEFDINERAHSLEMTTFPPDRLSGFTVRMRVFSNETFFGVPSAKGPSRKCWMRNDLDSLAAFVGLEDAGTMQVSDFIETTPPAVRVLDNADATGFVSQNSSARINADVDLWAAFQAAFPKAANHLGEKIYGKDRTVPAVLTVVGGRYLAAKYTSKDLIEHAQIQAYDLKRAGLVGNGVTPIEVLDALSSLKVSILFEQLGESSVKIVRPPNDKVAHVDLATMAQDEVITCKAAER